MRSLAGGEQYGSFFFLYFSSRYKATGIDSIDLAERFFHLRQNRRKIFRCRGTFERQSNHASFACMHAFIHSFIHPEEPIINLEAPMPRMGVSSEFSEYRFSECHHCRGENIERVLTTCQKFIFSFSPSVVCLFFSFC